MDALRHRVFAVLYGAEIQSIIGNQIARVALSVLVFQRTGSATATALTYAATFLPAILGGLLLASLGDRLPRRLLMIGCDLVRGGLFAAMAVPGMPIAALVALLVAAVFISPVFSAAQISYLAGTLEPEVFRVGTGLRMLTNQGAQVVGFAIGGVLVEALGPRGGLLVNAATFAVSAVAIATTLRGRSLRAPGPAPDPGDRPEPTGERRSVTRQLWGEHRLWTPLALSALAGLFVVPEGLAVPFGSGLGASASETGFLLASIPLGSAVGVLLLVRRVPKSRRAVVAHWMAIACGIPLVVTALSEQLSAALICWFLSGALSAYQVEVMTTVVQATPSEVRARMVGVANSVLLGAQGFGLIVFGEVAHRLDPGKAIGLAGGIGSALAALIVLVDRVQRARHRAARRLVPLEELGSGEVGHLNGADASAVGGEPASARSSSPRHARPRGGA